MNDAASHPDLSITVIDDDPELLTLITMLLRRIGATTDAFLDAHDALYHLQTHTPHLIILDLMMPGVDGLEVLQRIRRISRLDRVPILILSARVDKAAIHCALASGADGYITKPYIANSLIDRVQTLLSAGRTPVAQIASRPQRSESSQ